MPCPPPFSSLAAAQGWICRTNLPSNTAFRGFGGPQGMVAAEQVVERVAAALGRAPEDIKALNMYREGDVTHFGQALVGCQARPCWDEVRRLWVGACYDCGACFDS